jgi:transcriptional regulator with XRE-family HTH domain
VLILSTHFDSFENVTGYRLKEKREQLGLSQEQLARVLEVTLSTVARWEQLKDAQIPNSKMIELAIEGLELKLLNQGYKKTTWKDIARKILLNG